MRVQHTQLHAMMVIYMTNKYCKKNEVTTQVTTDSIFLGAVTTVVLIIITLYRLRMDNNDQDTRH